MSGRRPAAAGLMAALLALVAGAPEVAVADGAPPRPPPSARSLASACQLDFQLFCPDLDPESPRGEIAACLEDNRDALTEECRAVVDPGSIPRATHPQRDPIAAACSDDFVRLCGHEADRMAFARCVRTQRAKLSDACRDAMGDRGRGRSGGPGRRGPGGLP